MTTTGRLVGAPLERTSLPVGRQFGVGQVRIALGREATSPRPAKLDAAEGGPADPDGPDGNDPEPQIDLFTPTAAEVALINKYTMRPFAATELWTVPILAADNQANRHNERLTIPALHRLATKFAGRAGIHDHGWTTTKQTTRIYDAWVKSDLGAGKAEFPGESYVYLGLKLYMVRTEDNEPFRLSVEAGILKETSISFGLDWMAVKCTICGESIYDWWENCAHFPGQTYDGKLCLGEIPDHDALDPLENSWVPVPAEPNAGAIGRTHLAADSTDDRRTLIAKKEHALKSAELRSLLADPAALRAALSPEDASALAQVLARLESPAPSPVPATQDADGDEDDDSDACACCTEACMAGGACDGSCCDGSCGADCKGCEHQGQAAPAPGAARPSNQSGGQAGAPNTPPFDAAALETAFAERMQAALADQAKAFDGRVAIIEAGLAALAALVDAKVATVMSKPLVEGFAAGQPQSGGDPQSAGASLASKLLAP